MTEEQRLQEEYVLLKHQAEMSKERLEEKRQEIIQASGGNDFYGQILSLKTITRKGNIDYPSLLRFHNITEQESDAYRREDIIIKKITINPVEEE